jgi:hypothetical protein
VEQVNVNARVKADATEAHGGALYAEKQARRLEELRDKISRNEIMAIDSAAAVAAGKSTDAKDTQRMIRQCLKDLEHVAEAMGMLDAVLLDVHKTTRKITSQQEVNLEAQYCRHRFGPVFHTSTVLRQIWETVMMPF